MISSCVGRNKVEPRELLADIIKIISSIPYTIY